MNRAPGLFFVIAVIALLWNLLGCVAFLADLGLSPADVARLPEAQQALHAARPTWSIVATGVAVVGGVLGCIGLLLRRRWAVVLLFLSLAGIVAQDVAMFVLTEGLALAGTVPLLLQGVVLLIGIALVVLARRAARRGWLA